MKECTEFQIKVGFSRSAKAIFDEVEQVSAKYIRDGWTLDNAIVDESFGHITLFFVREIDLDSL